MNIKAWGLIVAGALILLAAGLFVYFGKSANKPVATSPETKSAEKPTASPLFSTLSDIFTNKSLSLTCNFTDNDGRNTQVFIKAGNVRANVTGKTATDSGSVIVADNTMYFWNGVQGMKLSFNLQELQNTANQASQTSQGQTALQDLEKYKESCKPTLVEDSMFTPPANVKFQDLSQMMKGAPGSNQGGAAIPSVNPTNYQELLRRYQK